MTATVTALAEYAERIRESVTGPDLQKVAEAIARDRAIHAEDRAQLQQMFAARTRELFPNAFKRGRR